MNFNAEAEETTSQWVNLRLCGLRHLVDAGVTRLRAKEEEKNTQAGVVKRQRGVRTVRTARFSCQCGDKREVMSANRGALPTVKNQQQREEVTCVMVQLKGTMERKQDRTAS